MAREIGRGRLHLYSGRKDNHESTGLAAFEHDRKDGQEAQNVVLYVSGLNEGLATVAYPQKISESLPPDWSLADVVLRSSYKGFGNASLHTDVADIGECVDYFRKSRSGKIVLLGHSTGCQDCVAYAVFPGYKDRRPVVDGLILQAAVSDREALESAYPKEELDQVNRLALKLVDEGKPSEILPRDCAKYLMNAPITAYRWLCMTSPNHDGDDDFFSTDLTDAQLDATFGKIASLGVPLAVILSGADAYVPPSVDKEALLDRWRAASERAGKKLDPATGVVPNASHNYEGNDSKTVQDLVGRVVDFVKRVTS